MKVTYIYHSAFLIETENTLLVFDYFKGQLPPLNPHKKLYVFNSHIHKDHFSLRVFDLFASHPETTYVLSDDIKAACPNRREKIIFVGPHQHHQVDELKIETLLSTDQGVAFIVETDGLSIYHAGDLQWWHWDESTPAENQAMEAAYKQEIDRLKGRHFHAAFLVLDPRQDSAFHLGFDYFMRTVGADAAYPMHSWGKRSLVDKLLALPCSANYRDNVVKLN